MMTTTNMFSIFDPSTSIMSFNWSSLLIPIILFTPTLYLIPSRSQAINFKLIKTIENEFKILLHSETLKPLPFVLIMTMMFIMTNNYMGLLPYIFTATSHIMITLMLAFPFWLAILLYGWINHMTHMFAHMVPQGTPPMLMMFMVLIESISVLIRPITLSVRLAANMIAGHLLISILGNFTVSASTMNMTVLLLVQNLLLILETAVAIIQSYVFVVLLALYMTEVDH
uniref:ATP synthase subunit a n=1 Tax=Nothopuga sp. 1 LP-2008 TaxID=504482 RepID=A9LI65_9ARAC|nr:ATP synthase F0 subunit 6 [Nothopuga sp. 1 LP-2008]ABS71894.1 ATP synthase F0 subunit 6 [Nothopuga sp. 1 LP-2008]